MTDLEIEVRDNLESAKSNGYWEEDLKKLSDEEVAKDMIFYASDLENYSVEDLIPFIKKWRNENS